MIRSLLRDLWTIFCGMFSVLFALAFAEGVRSLIR